MKNLVRKTYGTLVGFLLFGYPNMLCFAEAFLGDRLLFELDGASYSQRQVEVYALVRAAVATNATNLEFADRALWELAINDYITSRLINNFVGRDAQSPMSEQSWDKDAARYLEIIRGSSAFAMTFKRLTPSEHELDDALRLFRTVLRETQKRTPSVSVVSPIEAAQRFRTWFNDLRTRASLRIFHGALEYRSIRYLPR